MSFGAVMLVASMTTAAGQSAGAPAAQSTKSTSSTQTPSTQAGIAQAAQGQPEALPVSLDRIRKALDESPAFAVPKLRVDTSSLPLFRTHTESIGISLSSLLDDGTSVGAYVRPPNGPYDYEFKQMVTPDAVKGCGRLTQKECIQSFANQLATGLLWQHATQKKQPAAPSTPPPPDPETQRIRAQIQQELLDQQAAAAAAQTPALSKPSSSQPPQP